MTIAPNTRLDHYEILAPLGKGGMGEVYLARDARLSRNVALKLLPTEFTQSADRVRRFEHEAKAASALNHPNILTIYEIGATDHTHFIATEYIEGETLRQKLAREKLSLNAALEFALQMASALAAAHDASIIHRDIKPENVMLRKDGIVKVLDFGLAKLTEAKGGWGDREREGRGEDAPTLPLPQSPNPSLSTDAGTVMGTASYMSPEQARGERVDARSDIFSLGVVLYEMLAGQRPFEGANMLDIVGAVLHQEPKPLTNQPAELQRIVGKALQKDRERRYQTSKDLLLDIQTLKHELEIEARLKGRDASNEVAQTVSLRPDTTDELQDNRTTSSASIILSELKRHKRGVMIALVGLVLLLSGIGYGLYRVIEHYSSTSTPPLALQFTPLTSHGRAVAAAISPDGKYVVYAKDEGGKQSLWLRQTAVISEQAISPAADVFYSALTFSRDGNFLYYVTQEPNPLTNSLYRMSVLGQGQKKLIEGVNSVITFSPDGKRLAFVRGGARTSEMVLIIADTEGGNERVLAVRKKPDTFLAGNSTTSGGLAWSPDGRLIACIVGSGFANNYKSVLGINVETGAEQPLTDQKWAVVMGDLAWLPDSSGLVVLVAGQLWRISQPDGAARQITSGLNSYTTFSMTEDARVLVIMSESLSSIWTAPAGNPIRIKPITAKVGKRDGIAGLAWVPDGRIIFATWPSEGVSAIWVMNADGSNQRQIHADPNIINGLSVSADGRYLVFSSQTAEGRAIARLDMQTGSLKQLVSRRQCYSPSFSPDGKWVIYRDTSSDKRVLWKVPSEGGTPEKLSDSEAVIPALSPDGALIAYQTLEQGVPKLAVISFAEGQPVKTFDYPISKGGIRNFNAFHIRWTPDGHALTYILTPNNVSNLWHQPFDGGPPKQITDFKAERIHYFDWSRDGKLVLARGTDQNDVVLISGFR